MYVVTKTNKKCLQTKFQIYFDKSNIFYTLVDRNYVGILMMIP